MKPRKKLGVQTDRRYHDGLLHCRLRRNSRRARGLVGAVEAEITRFRFVCDSSCTALVTLKSFLVARFMQSFLSLISSRLFERLVVTTNMPPTHISGASRAIYRVFIAPTLYPSNLNSFLYAPTFATLQTTTLPSQRHTRAFKQQRYVPHGGKEAQRHRLTDHFVLNNAIDSDYVNVVDEKGEFTANVPLRDAIYEGNRNNTLLLQVSPGKVDASGRMDPQALPTCRVVTKEYLNLQLSDKLKKLREQAKSKITKGKNSKAGAKTLELNWAIASGDLKHRLGRLKEFLSEGRKVEILLGPKKRGRRATEQEAAAVLQALREAAAECKGSTEVKSDGKVGGIMTIIFEGRIIEEKSDTQKNEAQLP